MQSNIANSLAEQNEIQIAKLHELNNKFNTLTNTAGDIAQIIADGSRGSRELTTLKKSIDNISTVIAGEKNKSKTLSDSIDMLNTNVNQLQELMIDGLNDNQHLLREVSANISPQTLNQLLENQQIINETINKLIQTTDTITYKISETGSIANTTLSTQEKNINRLLAMQQEQNRLLDSIKRGISSSLQQEPTIPLPLLLPSTRFKSGTLFDQYLNDQTKI